MNIYYIYLLEHTMRTFSRCRFSWAIVWEYFARRAFFYLLSYSFMPPLYLCLPLKPEFDPKTYLLTSNDEGRLQLHYEPKYER